ncbi:MAG TPA: TIGR03560 family F420-dependent LLM class oxidoreductase, partial [Blastocatellia bacterium]|nr:TIGR03560 family F420-dependent LLM class oxidoreductase [Blastocatellia bacterium]
MTKPVRFGIQTPTQNTTWQELRETWKLIDELAYDTAWTFDHFFPILSDPSGPCLEGWMLLAALAAEAPRVELGVLVTGNTYRHPAVLAKMGATLDHTSDGRLIMGLGAGWFEMEHEAYGIPFYTVAERIRRSDEAAEIIKRLWTEPQVTFEGRYYKLKDAYCEPKPVRKPRPPLLIGGAGEKLMLRVVARHADQWNTFGSPALFRHKLEVLGEHCAAVGRSLDEIEVSWAGTMLVTDSKGEKEEAVRRMAEAFGQPPETVEPGLLVGSAEEIKDRLHEYVEAGVTHFISIA